MQDRPIAAGVRALVLVAVIGGVVAAGAVAVAVKTSAIGRDRSAIDSGMTLSMPPFTSEPNQLQPVVLRSVPPTASATPTDEYTDSSTPTVSSQPLPSDQSGVFPINLQSGERNVTILLDLSGTYPQGEGAVLQVQQLVTGTWVDFAPPGQTGQFVVGGGLFSGSITPTGKGLEQFRVRNVSNGDVSNSVSVNVG
ncbi:hypothetical protein Back2_15760 [Nocardioides baekrokdamisoli]|uniref:Uncharacterized protein n=2 Tax=Nocardioides baekrokdamisoli TaxID=1804624 RepID=A0A3G9J2R0_9ACTN|nr:hypothetical protein Back2_15760 [Nocardioides baekrokdamisoli]